MTVESVPIYLESTYGPMTSALALSAGKHSAVSYDVRHTNGRRVEVRAYPMTILGQQLVAGLTAEHSQTAGSE